MTVRPFPSSWLDEPVTAGALPDKPGFSLPVGTVTFLLTDVENSTRQWEVEPEAMAAAIARHYALLDDAIASHNGVRPVEQGEGDSVVGAFARASDALAAVLDAQLRLRGESWPDGVSLAVRMALHTGEAEPAATTARTRAGAEPVRSAAGARPRAARCSFRVRPRISWPTAADDGLSLADLGVHRLRDLSRPEHVSSSSSAPELPA